MGAPLDDAVAALARNVESGLHSGAQLYVSCRGEVMTDAAVGTRDGVAPMTTSTLVPWMCAGKPLTSIAIGRLVDLGLLEFDTPVVDVIGEWAQAGEYGVTVRHLLTHTVPFTHDVAVGTFATSWERIITRITRSRLEPGIEAGSAARYTVLTGWFALGEVIQRVTGEEIRDHLERHVITPLGLDPCHVGINRLDRSAVEIAELYDTSSGAPRPSFLVAASGTDDLPSPGLGTWGNASALGQMYERLLAIRAGATDRGTSTLRADTLHEMTTTARELLHCSVYASNVEWGLGFVSDRRLFCGPRSGAGSFGHDGRNASIAFADPDNDLVVSVVTNGMPRPTRSWRRFRTVIELVYDAVGVPQRQRALDRASREPS